MRDLPTTFLKPFLCPYCGKRMDAATPTDRSDVRPSEGYASVCIECGGVSIFGPDLRPGKPEPGVLEARLAEDPQFAQLIKRTQRIIRARKRAAPAAPKTIN